MAIEHQKENQKYYLDNQGYFRFKHNKKLVHRFIAKHEIYDKNKDEYPLNFSEYIVHHIDKIKTNNKVSNLKLVTKKEHDRIHGINPPDKSQTELPTNSKQEESIKKVHEEIETKAKSSKIDSSNKSYDSDEIKPTYTGYISPNKFKSVIKKNKRNPYKIPKQITKKNKPQRKIDPIKPVTQEKPKKPIKKEHKCNQCNRPINHKGNCLACNIKNKRERDNLKKPNNSVFMVIGVILLFVIGLSIFNMLNIELPSANLIEKPISNQPIDDEYISGVFEKKYNEWQDYEDICAKFCYKECNDNNSKFIATEKDTRNILCSCCGKKYRLS